MVFSADQNRQMCETMSVEQWLQVKHALDFVFQQGDGFGEVSLHIRNSHVRAVVKAISETMISTPEAIAHERESGRKGRS